MPKVLHLLTHRLAASTDLPALRALMTLAIDQLQRDFLSAEQVASSHGFMGLDTQLVQDGTYFMVFRDGALAGCGGWSRRATPFGHDSSPGRDNRLLDPATEPARVRAMYTHPDHVRQGVGSHILALCEQAAAGEGFSRLELTATMAGVPLYRACGFSDVDRLEQQGVPMILMQKPIIA